MRESILTKLTTTFRYVIILTGFSITTNLYADDNFTIGGNDSEQKNQHQIAQIIPGQKVLKNNIESLFYHQGDPIAGNSIGTITLVEFFDYRCPHSIKMDHIINALIQSNPELRVVYKQFPKFGEASDYAAKAVLAAQRQGRYIDMHNALIHAGKSLDDKKILEIAASLHLNIDQLKNDMNSKQIKTIIQENMQLTHILKINSVPLMFIGKTSLAYDSTAGAIAYVLGEVSQQQIQSLINNR